MSSMYLEAQATIYGSMNMTESSHGNEKRVLTNFPVTFASNAIDVGPKNKNSKKPSTKRKLPSNKGSDRTSKLVASDKVLLELYPSCCNYTLGRDRTNDTKKEDFPQTNKSCHLLFKHIKKHGLGFILDLELDAIQMEYLLVVSWKAFSNITFSDNFYPENSLQNVLPVFPYPQLRTKKRIKKYYKRHLHRKDTLRSTTRGGHCEAISRRHFKSYRTQG